MVALIRRLSGISKALSLLSGPGVAPLRALLEALAEILIGPLRTSKASPIHFPLGYLLKDLTRPAGKYSIFLPREPRLALLLPAPDRKGCIFGLARQKKIVYTPR